MDPRERIRRAYTGIIDAVRAELADVYTAMPGQVVKVTTTGELTVSVQPLIQGQQRKPDGSWNYITLPVLIHCPIITPSGGGFTMTFPTAVGDEGLIVWAQRAIDNWWVQGGVQKQAELRMHDISDGFFIPGCFSKPNTPSSISTNSVKIMSKDGTKYMEFTSAGDLHVTGKVIAGFGGVDQVGLQTHTHPGNGQPPTPGS